MAHESMKVDLTFPKRRVMFSVTDGLRPSRGKDGVFDILSPLDLVFHPNSQQHVDLGISCNKPVQVFSFRRLKESGVRMRSECFDADENVGLTFANISTQPIEIKHGDIIARLHILDDSDWERDN